MFVIPQAMARQASLSLTISWSLPKFMSIESNAIPPSHPLSPCSLSAFNLSQHQGLFIRQFASGGQSIGASALASVLPMNIPGWFPSVLTGLISSLSKGLKRVFSSTSVWKHQFFISLPFLWSDFHICTWLLEKPSLWLCRPLSAGWWLCVLIYCLGLS